MAVGGGKRWAASELPQKPDGRESPGTDFSGRTGASSGDLTGWCSKRRSIFATVPAALNLPACPPRLPGAPNPLGRNLPCTTPSLPGYHPDTPTPTPPSVRLPRTMPCYGTPRVRVLECPPLGRPSLIKLVLVKTRSIVDNANPGIAPPPRAWSIQTGQCSGTRPHHSGPCVPPCPHPLYYPLPSRKSERS